jgi:hypothetical protein
MGLPVPVATPAGVAALGRAALALPEASSAGLAGEIRHLASLSAGYARDSPKWREKRNQGAKVLYSDSTENRVPLLRTILNYRMMNR